MMPALPDAVKAFMTSGSNTEVLNHTSGFIVTQMTAKARPGVRGTTRRRTFERAKKGSIPGHQCDQREEVWKVKRTDSCQRKVTNGTVCQG
jgi:hypothetical protein